MDRISLRKRGQAVLGESELARRSLVTDTYPYLSGCKVLEGDLPQMLTKDPIRSFNPVSGMRMLRSRIMPYQRQ